MNNFIGEGAAEMAGVGVLALHMEATLEDLARASSPAAGPFLLLLGDSHARVLMHSLPIEGFGDFEFVDLAIFWNAAKGYLSRDEAESALERLEATSLWLLDRIRWGARQALEEIMSSKRAGHR